MLSNKWKKILKTLNLTIQTSPRKKKLPRVGLLCLPPQSGRRRLGDRDLWELASLQAKQRQQESIARGNYLCPILQIFINHQVGSCSSLSILGFRETPKHISQVPSLPLHRAEGWAPSQIQETRTEPLVLLIWALQKGGKKSERHRNNEGKMPVSPKRMWGLRNVFPISLEG